MIPTLARSIQLICCRSGPRLDQTFGADRSRCILVTFKFDEGIRDLNQVGIVRRYEQTAVAGA